MAFRSSSQLAIANVATIAVPVPASAANLDIAVAGIYMESTAAITGIPTGFTNKVSLQNTAATRGRLDVFWKRLTGADSGTYTFSWTGATFTAAACGLWSGRATSGDPFDNFVGGTGSAESTAGVTTLNVAGAPGTALGDAVGFWTNVNGGATFTAPASYTQQQAVSGVIALETRDAIAAGATGNVTASVNITDFMKAFLGVLQPAGATATKAPQPISQYGSFY